MPRWILVKKPEEEEIIRQLGWPSLEAKVALFDLYLPVIREWVPFYYRANTIAAEDIIQEALAEAWARLDDFDPEKASFAIFLNIWLKPVLRDFVAKMEGCVSVPRSVLTCGFPDLEWNDGDELYKSKKLTPIAMAKLGRRSLSLQWPVRVKDPQDISQYVTLQDTLESEEPEGEVDPFIIDLIEELPTRERQVVTARLLGYSFDEIAMLEETPRRRRVSKQWVHKIWQRAIAKIRARILERDELEAFDEYFEREEDLEELEEEEA